MGGYSAYLSCDFETTVNIEHTCVWLAGNYNIFTGDFTYQRTIDEWFNWIQQYKNSLVWFHNLKFDGGFILNYLMSHGYTWTNERKPPKNCFSTCISDMNQWYTMKINTGKAVINIRDSAKVIRLPVRDIPKAFGLSEKKGSIEYETYTEWPEHVTPEEIEYLRLDCVIVGKAIAQLWTNGHHSITSASNAMAAYRQDIGKNNFAALFPILDKDVDAFIRQAYKGGYVYVAEEYKNAWLGRGFVVDVNSLYPSRCASVEHTPLPFGTPMHFTGKPTSTKWKLWVAKIKCMFELKEGMLPTIQIKNNPRDYIGTEYLTTSAVEGYPTVVELVLTSIDYKIFTEHYEISELEWVEGYYFNCSEGLWKHYIEENMRVKEQATRDGNAGLRTMAKGNMNEPTGKFATRPGGITRMPYYEEETGIVKYKTIPDKERKLIYTPMSCFITAWGRKKMIETAQRLHDSHQFVYCDTDSAHCIGKMPKWLYDECDHTALGKWDIEGCFIRAKFIRAKTYMELTKRKIKEGDEYYGKADYTYKWNIKCAGLPEAQRSQVTPDNFNIGQVYTGKLLQKTVPGGVVLVETNFEIKEG